jgi:hypothetical protein
VRAVANDYCTNKFLFRNTAGRVLVWVEDRAYKKLKDIKGMLASYRAIDGLALRMNQIPGRDLKRVTNILTANDGLPYMSHPFPHGSVIPSLSAQFPCQLQASCNHVPR